MGQESRNVLIFLNSKTKASDYFCLIAHLRKNSYLFKQSDQLFVTGNQKQF